jgi:hypothetical protein
LTAAPITAPLIDGKDGGRRRVDRHDQVARRAFDGPVETGAEQRIDDRIRRRHAARSCGLGRTAPALRRECRVIPQAAGVAQEQEPHPVAALGQEPRRHEAIAAVVAGTGDNYDAASGRMALRDCIGYRQAGLLHQIDAGYAARNRHAVRFAHLRAGQQLYHGSRHY